MEQKTSLKIILAVLGGTLTVLMTILAFTPLLNDVFAVEVPLSEPPAVTEAPLPEKPEELLVTAVYEMAEDSKKISAIYIEVFHVGSNVVSYVEVPVDTKVTLSEELYKSLQTYAPELPQYMKLSNMAEGFSKEYGLTGCNRILSEVLGITLSEYVRADGETLSEWMSLQTGEKTATGFFEAYAKWLDNTSSGLVTEERWMYYESWQQITEVSVETAPGSREKDGYLISAKRSKERLQELMAQPADNREFSEQ